MKARYFCGNCGFEIFGTPAKDPKTDVPIHHSCGRTFREATEAGNCYSVRMGDAELTFPGCTTVEECLGAAAQMWPRGAEVKVYRHLPGSRIGATYVEIVDGEHRVR